MNAPLPFLQRPRDPNERDFSRYQQLRRQWAAEILENEAREEDWTSFKVAVRRLGKDWAPADFLTWLRSSWLVDAHPDVKMIALREIAHRCDAIRVSQGLEPLSDPVPGQPDSLFIRCRNLLGVR